MAEYFALCIPIFLGLIAFFLFNTRVTIGEVILPTVACMLLIFTMKGCSTSYNTSDTEYHTNKAYKVVYEEDWNEYIEKTCTKTVCTGSGKDEKCHTETYDCSYVDYHPATYTLIDDAENSYSISPLEFEKICKKWHDKHWVNMYRDYHNNDGDKYYGEWNGDIKTLITTHSTHSYENRVQAARSIYNYEELTEKDVKDNRLIEYPDPNGYEMPAILSNDVKFPKWKQDELNRINGILGAKKQVQVFLLVWKNMPSDVAEMQKAYWKGGNKNELVICVGVDKNENIVWNNVFTWSEKDIVKIKIRDYLLDERGKKLNIKGLSKFTETVIVKDWKRKQFKDFAYLHIELTRGQVIWIYIMTTIVSIGLTIFIVVNGYNPVYTVSKFSTDKIKQFFKNLVYKLRVFFINIWTKVVKLYSKILAHFKK